MRRAMQLLTLLVTSYEMLTSAYEKKTNLTDANIQDFRQLGDRIGTTLTRMAGEPDIATHWSEFQFQKRLFEETKGRFDHFLTIRES